MSTGLRRSSWAIIGAAAVLAFGAGGVLIASAATGSPSSFVPTDPVRVLDTREAASPIQTLGEGATVTLALTGRVPAEATAVALNVTAVSGTAQSFLTIWPTGGPMPQVSSVNWKDGAAYPNAVHVELGTNLSINIRNNVGMVDVVIDLNGYYVPAPATGPVPSAGNWGVINRNTTGSPTADLRNGPVTPPLGQITPLSAPPFGTGSLNLGVATGELATFGNEIDFLGQPFSLTAVGFHVYNLPENVSVDPGNMPNIAIEINPNLTASTDHFTSAVYFPPPTLPGAWSNYIDATTTGVWGLTGAEFEGQTCGINTNRCTWTELQTLLDDGGDAATMFTVAVKKGADFTWHGAVDGLRINSTVYDFEEHGVIATAA
jgi:hypothetical protein